MVLTVLVLTLILTIILLSRHLKKNAGIIYLIYILVLFSLRQIQFFSYQSIQYPELAALLNVHILPFSLLIGPCVLYFLKSYYKGQFYIDRYFIIHAIPSFLMLVNISNYLCLPFQLKVNYYLWSQNQIGLEPRLSSSIFFFSPLMKLLPIVVLVCYIIYSGLYLFREYRKESFSRKIKMLQFLSQFVLLAFLNYIPFLVVIGVLIKINGINNTYLFRFPSGFSLDYLNIISLALPLSFFLFPDFLFGRESKFFSKSTYFNRLLTGNFALAAHLNLTQVDSDFTLIEGYMITQKPYLDLDFSVQKISQELQIPRNRISEAFSVKLNKSFPQYRNQLRILHSIDLLKDNFHKNYSIEGIAVKSGFKNKSTFYAAFKIETGVTPIDWIKENIS
jgi:AraC-like DNA-binding protein